MLFLVLTSITVITLDFRGDGGGLIGRVRNVATDAFAPVRDTADSVFSPVGDAFSGITGYGELEDENARLRSEIADMKGQRSRNEDAEVQLEELLSLERLDFVGGMTTVAARVVSAPVSNFEQTIELDRGTSDGVDVDMPVITGAGLVGRVVEASGERAMVRLVTDPGSSVGIRVSRSGETGIAQGEGPNRTLSVGFIDVAADVTRGDLAVTSGLEGGSDVYPAGIPIGRVVRAQKVPGELQQRVDVRPLADIAHLRFVKVLRVPR